MMWIDWTTPIASFLYVKSSLTILSLVHLVFIMGSSPLEFGYVIERVSAMGSNMFKLDSLNISGAKMLLLLI